MIADLPLASSAVLVLRLRHTAGSGLPFMGRHVVKSSPVSMFLNWFIAQPSMLVICVLPDLVVCVSILTVRPSQLMQTL